jgi:hypothetical protein
MQQLGSGERAVKLSTGSTGDMEKLRVYLRGELGKLKNRGDARNFTKAIDEQLLIDLNLGNKVKELQIRFSTQKKVNEFVDGLEEDDLVRLVRQCDKEWRKNEVFKKLTECNRWRRIEINVRDVYVQQAEPHLAEYFEQNDCKLSEIAADQELMSKEPYSRHKPGENVAYPVLLAHQKGSRIVVFDGVHRAIQLARNGEMTVQLYCCTAAEDT